MTRHRGRRRRCPRIPTGRETELKPPTVWVRIPPGTPPTVTWVTGASRAASRRGPQPQQGGPAGPSRSRVMQPGGTPDPAQGEGHPAAPSRCRRGHRFPGQPTAGPDHRRVCSLAQHRDPRAGSADAAPPISRPGRTSDTGRLLRDPRWVSSRGAGVRHDGKVEYLAMQKYFARTKFGNSALKLA